MVNIAHFLNAYAKKNLSEEDTLKQFDHVILIFAKEKHAYARTYMVPKLEKIYNELKEKRTSMEFIFVSCDDSEAEFKRFTKSLPFKVIPYADETREALIKLFIPEMKMIALPRVVTCSGQNGSILNANAEQHLHSHAEHGQGFPWTPGGGDAAAMACAATCMFCTIS